MDRVTQEVRSETMRAVRSSNSKMEVAFRKLLFSKGIRYRKNVSDLPGKPDIAIKSKKIVIFLDSCFWHGCPQHLRRPQSNKVYWDSKIELNKKRDQNINNEYRKMGWRIIRFWEHEIRVNQYKAIERIIKYLS